MTIINTIQDIEALKLENKYHIEQLEEKLKQKKQIEVFHPCKLEINEGDGYGTLWLNRDKKISINKDYRGQWNISHWISYPEISSSRLNEIYKQFPQPNNFKVLNAKIISSWIHYYSLVDTQAKKENLENHIKITNYLGDVDALVKTYNCKSQLSKDGRSGWLEKGDFELNFVIASDGYISQKIRIKHTVEENLEGFKKLIK